MKLVPILTKLAPIINDVANVLYFYNKKFTFLLKNQNVATLAGQLTINGCPIAIRIAPMSTKKNPLFMSVNRNIPTQ